MIPIIDLKEKNILDVTEEAYTTVGFAVFINSLNNEEQKKINEWVKTIKAFFDMSLDFKNKHEYKGGIPIFGYTNPTPLKEIFDFQNLKETENLWPNIDNFKYNALAAQKVAESHTLRILKIFDTILDSGTTLVDAHRADCNPLEFSRVLKYPAYDGIIGDNEMRMDQHRDYGTITSIWQINNTPGLEVRDLKGNWHLVPYAANGVVVNVGDLLQRWSNDYFVSTEHRVNCSNMHLNKYSMPHFAHPKMGTIISNLCKNKTAKYEPIESKEYLMERLRRC
jgi:isopenicillin N synthase-like dioxygenase